jgi:hypothetical protein
VPIFCWKALERVKKCIFMACGRGRCQNGRVFGLKWLWRLGRTWQHCPHYGKFFLPLYSTWPQKSWPPWKRPMDMKIFKNFVILFRIKEQTSTWLLLKIQKSQKLVHPNVHYIVQKCMKYSTVESTLFTSDPTMDKLQKITSCKKRQRRLIAPRLPLGYSGTRPFLFSTPL